MLLIQYLIIAWQRQAAKRKANEITREEYDRWRYHYPDFDATQIRASVPSREITDGLLPEQKSKPSARRKTKETK